MNPVPMLSGECSVPPCSDLALTSVHKVLCSRRLCEETRRDPHPLLARGGVDGKHTKVPVAAQGTAGPWHRCHSLWAVCRTWFHGLGREPWIVARLGNGSRERLGDLPGSVAEDAQRSHLNSQENSKYSLPALMS